MDRRSSSRRWLLASLKTAASIGLLSLLAAKVDMNTVGTTFATVSTSTQILAVLLLIGQVPILAWRWLSIIRQLDGKIQYSRTLFITYVGLFFNQALPASVGGDVIRIWGSRQSGVELRTAVNSVLLERLSGLLSLVLILAATLPAIWNELAHLGALRHVLAMLLPLALVSCAALYAAERRFGGATRRSILRAAVLLSADFRILLGNPAVTLGLLLLSIGSHLLVTGAVYVVGLDLGLRLPFASYLGLVSAAIIATVIPISIAGWGVREGVMVAMFSAAGVDAESALVLSLLFGLALLIASLPGGVLWLIDRRS